MRRSRFCVAIGLCCLPLACNSRDAESISNTAAVSAAAPAQVDRGTGSAARASDDAASIAVAPASGVTARVMSWDDAQALIAARKGKVVIVDIWSNDCVPCLREFPHLVALQKAHLDRVAGISINIDFLGIEPAPTEALCGKVLAFLRAQNAATENVICSDAADDIYKRVDFVSIPAVYVYDESGKLAKLFKNDAREYGKDGFGYEKHIVPLVQQLLGEK